MPPVNLIPRHNIHHHSHQTSTGEHQYSITRTSAVLLVLVFFVGSLATYLYYREIYRRAVFLANVRRPKDKRRYGGDAWYSRTTKMKGMERFARYGGTRGRDAPTGDDTGSTWSDTSKQWSFGCTDCRDELLEEKQMIWDSLGNDRTHWKRRNPEVSALTKVLRLPEKVVLRPLSALRISRLKRDRRRCAGLERSR